MTPNPPSTSAPIVRTGRFTSSPPNGKAYTHTEHLRLDDPDPYGPNSSDPAAFKLLCETDMEHHTFEL